MNRAATLFLAIQLPEPTHLALGPFLDQLARIDPGLRPARADGLHLTLRYLGAVDARRMGLVGPVAARVAASTAPFRVALAGMGTFPAGQRPLVLWLGVEQGRLQLTRLAVELSLALAAVGWEPDSRPFQPHCTLARLPGNLDQSARAALAEVCRGSGPGQPLPIRATELALLESVPTPGGPNRYPCRARWTLQRS